MDTVCKLCNTGDGFEGLMGNLDKASNWVHQSHDQTTDAPAGIHKVCKKRLTKML